MFKCGFYLLMVTKSLIWEQKNAQYKKIFSDIAQKSNVNYKLIKKLQISVRMMNESVGDNCFASFDFCITKP